jgi:hypothetical protein
MLIINLKTSIMINGGSYEGANALGRSQLGNNTLRWETSSQAGVGIDGSEIMMAEFMELVANFSDLLFMIPIL